MSNFIKGDAVILWIWDTSGTPAYKPTACLTSTSLSQTRNIIESQTKCAPGLVEKDAGSLNNEISLEGQYIDTTSTPTAGDDTKMSHDALFELMNAGTPIDWRMSTGLTDTAYYYGTESILSSLELSADAGDSVATFSGTLSVSGAIVTTDPHV